MQNTLVDQLLRSLLPAPGKQATGLSFALLILGVLVAFAGLLALISCLLLGCWNGFVSPVFGTRSLDFVNAIWLTVSLLVVLSIILSLKEVK